MCGHTHTRVCACEEGVCEREESVWVEIAVGGGKRACVGVREWACVRQEWVLVQGARVAEERVWVSEERA